MKREKWVTWFKAGAWKQRDREGFERCSLCMREDKCIYIIKLFGDKLERALFKQKMVYCCEKDSLQENFASAVELRYVEK